MAGKRSDPQDIGIEEALRRAHAHWNAGQTDQAELFCQRVLAAWPGQADALHLLGVMAHAFGNLDLAIQHLRQACQAPRAPAPYFSNLAEMCRQKGLLDEAEQAARRAVALDAGLVAGWNNLGIVLQEAGRLDESLACLERVVSLQPGSPQMLNNLGNTCKRLGRLGQAERCYAQALSFDPDYAEAHSNRANLLNDLGRLDEAAASARRAIELNPQLADAYLNLAGVEQSRQRHGETLRWLDALLSFAPLHVGALSARARVLRKLGRLDEALAAARQAVSLAPQDAKARCVLGEVLQALGRFDAALEEFDRAAALPGLATEEALVSRAILHMEMGRTAEAKAAFQRALEAFPRSAQVLFNASELHRFTADDPLIGRMEALLTDEGQPLADRIVLRFALGKAYLDIGEVGRAFIHLGHGNRLKRATLSFDAAATSRWLETIADAFSAARLQAGAGAGDPSDLPVFIVGMPRSGTTLIEQILASHPQVHGAGELIFLETVVGGIAGYPQAVERLDRRQLGGMGAAYLARVAPLAAGKRHVVDKMPANFLHVGLIRLILPNARIIHCRRDAVDTCLSCYTKLFADNQPFAYDQRELGQFHRAYQTLMDHWRAVLPADRFIEVDYEAVVDDLEGQARRLTDFLGLPWDEACLRFHQTERPVRTASANQVRQPLYKTSKGRWKACAEHLRPLLAALGTPH